MASPNCSGSRHWLKSFTPVAVSRCGVLSDEALSNTLLAAYTALDQLEGDNANAQSVVDLLEDAGSQLGHLQVACCSPARTKLYSESLERLGRTQRLIKRTLEITESTNPTQ